MNATLSPAKILVLLTTSADDHDFECDDCGAYVARLKQCDIANLTNPETYALKAVIENRNQSYLGVGVKHRGRRIQDGYCRNVFYFCDVAQGVIDVVTTVRIPFAHAATN